MRWNNGRAWGWVNGGQPILVCYIRKYVIILGGYSRWRSPNQNIGGCVPVIPGGVDWRQCSTILTIGSCKCARVSVTIRSSIETDGQIGLVLAKRLPSSYSILRYNEIWISGYVPSELCPEPLNLEEFPDGHRSYLYYCWPKCTGYLN